MLFSIKHHLEKELEQPTFSSPLQCTSRADWPSRPSLLMKRQRKSEIWSECEVEMHLQQLAWISREETKKVSQTLFQLRCKSPSFKIVSIIHSTSGKRDMEFQLQFLWHSLFLGYLQRMLKRNQVEGRMGLIRMKGEGFRSILTRKMSLNKMKCLEWAEFSTSWNPAPSFTKLRWGAIRSL